MTTRLGPPNLVNASDAAAQTPATVRARQPDARRWKPCLSSYSTASRIRRRRTCGVRTCWTAKARRKARVLQFYPSRDKNAVFCLWESNSIDELREYADGVMGDSSENSYFEVDAEIARGLPKLVGA